MREQRQLAIIPPNIEVSSFQSASGAYRSEVEQGAHLLDYWRVVQKRIWLITGITLLITTLVGIYVVRKPNVYEAQARVQIDSENSINSLVSSSKSSGPVILNSGNDPSYFNTQLQILTGPGLLRRVAKTLNLEHDPAFSGANKEKAHSVWQTLRSLVMPSSNNDTPGGNVTVEEIPLAASGDADVREDSLEASKLAPYVEKLQESLKVEPVVEKRTGSSRDTRLVDIKFTGNDPQKAARIINAVAETFVSSNLEKRTATNTTAGDFLQKRVTELQTQIRNGEERLINYAKENQILSLDPNQNTVVERLSGLSKQLLDAENERKMAEAAYNAAQAPGAASALASSAVGISEDSARQIADTESQLATLRQKRAQLLVENTEEWPEVQEVDKQIVVLEKHISDTRDRAASIVVKNLDTKYRQALAREASLRAAFEKQSKDTLVQNQAAINYRIIQQEIETNKSLLDGLLQRSKENDVMLAGTLNNIHVIDYAVAPDQPVGPKRMLTVILALMLSLAAGIGLAFLLEYLDDSLRSVEDVENVLALPALGAIPLFSSRSRKLAPAQSGALTSGADGMYPELLIKGDARSPIAEAFRQLRTSVLLSTAGRTPKTLLITSSQPSEGKTTTSVNSAISLAQTGAQVLLIDADMRRPRLHQIFDVENRAGLSTILSSDMGHAEMNELICQTKVENLFVLPSGPVPPNPAELVGSDRMRALLSNLETTFSHIVLDSPPVGGFTDGVLIASIVDGVLLVVNAGTSSRAIVRRSKQRLQDIGAKIFGVVLNNVSQAHDEYDYTRYYSSPYPVEGDYLPSSAEG